MSDQALPPAVARKLELLFRGMRYSEALGDAARDAFPNFHPYRFQAGEHDPTGQGKATIPYLMRFADGTVVRVLGDSASPWSVAPGPGAGYSLQHREGHPPPVPVDFEPRPAWLGQRTRAGIAMSASGLSLHGDMAVVNVAPGCEYFLPDPDDGAATRCSFCTYGAPDARTRALGQDMHSVSLPRATYDALQDTLAAGLTHGGIRHIYLVGGSLRDWHAEGARFIELARRVQEVVGRETPVTCGSGALPDDALDVLHRERLVDAVCFNLEVWPPALFETVCPGKARYVGRDRWIASLESAVARWGRGHVYSAMVAGIELEPEHAMSVEQAVGSALTGARDLCSRGIIPIYSLYWPKGGRQRENYLSDLMSYFARLNLGCKEIRAGHGLRVWDGFMCHRCAYMQLECDLDRAAVEGAGE